MGIKVDVTKDMLKGLMHFILLKYQEDVFHTQGTSNKSDYIGGFIDRWINRAPESIVFNEGLFKDKDYKVINDYFIYSNQADKNAPDIIGIRCETGDTIKFCEFNKNKWEKLEYKPYIEVKTFKKNQSLVCIKAGQQITSNDYYVLVESDFEKNYLTGFFDDTLFDDQNMNLITMDEVFIKDNENSILKRPNEVELKIATNNLGTLSIIGIITGEKISQILDVYNKKENVIYLKKIEKKSDLKRVNKLIDEDFNDVFNHINEDFYKIEKNNIFNKRRESYLRMVKIQVKNPENIKIKKVNQKSIYIELEKESHINGEKLEKGIYKLIFDDFSRSSDWEEYITTKSLFKNNVISDMTTDLIKLFDDIYEKHRLES
ncbi:hypothetical protein [Paraclostridium bifermentans]|uniref:hypothetical protein n=1 Tax=Paraclostridium bifermentans TaxID=1490 RepID=UPI00374E8062